MSLLQEEYKLAIDNKMLSPKVSEQDFEKMLKDDTKRKEYWDYCHQKNPSFYADDYNRFSQLTTEMLGEANRPSVAENPAPTTAEEDSINLAKQNEGEQQYNVVAPMIGEQTVQQSNSTAAEPIQEEEKKEEQSALDRGMQIIDDAWDKSGFLGKAFLSPMKLAEVGISLVQGAASGIVEWGGRGAMSLMAQAVENNKAGDYDTFKVDAMGNPMFVPKIGEDGQYEKAGYSIEEQIEAAKRVEKAEAEGKEADIKDKNASMYVRAANKLEKVADKLHKSSMPKDVAEDATFIDLIREGEIMDAVQLSVASTGQSIPYMLLNSLPAGGFIAGTLGQANTYLDLSKEHPEMEKWKRYTYAIGSSGIEQAVEKFTNPFKGLKGASKKEVAKTLKDITDGAEKAIWKRVTGNVLKEAAGEGGEELATSVFTDIFGTMIDTDGEYGIGIIGQYNEYANQMREQNPSMTDNDILKSFVGNKAKEYAESFIMGALSGAYISTASSIATRDYAKEEQKNNRVMLDAITATADANGLAKEDVLGIVMKEKDGELTDEENSVAKLFKKNYAKATMKSVAEEQGNELVEKIANKSNGYVFEVDFADGSLGETDMAYIVDGAVHTTDVDGKAIIDKTTSDKVVYVKVLKEDGSEDVKQVAVDELNLVGTPMQSGEFSLQYQQGIYNTAEQLLDAQEQVVGEDNGQQPLGAMGGEQGRNIEGRQFTNGQQTITASNPDSNGNVTLSAPVTLPNGVVTDQVMPQQVFDDLMNGLIREEGWQEVSSQPTNQGQAQGQQQAPQPISWSEMDANQATATVVERSKGDKVRAKKFAQKQVEVKTKALQEAQAEMDAFEGDDLYAFNAAQDKVDAAQAEVDKWTAVANGIDAYVAPVQVAPQPTPSATSASGNGVVTEAAEDKQIIVNTAETALSELNKINTNGKIAQKADKLRRRLAQVKASSTATADDARALLGEVQELIDLSENSEAVWTAFGNAQAAQSSRQSASNPQQSANNSQNTLQNENNSVPLQGLTAQEVIDRIQDGRYKIVLFGSGNWKTDMRKGGASEALINAIEQKIREVAYEKVDWISILRNSKLDRQAIINIATALDNGMITIWNFERELIRLGGNQQLLDLVKQEIKRNSTIRSIEGFEQGNSLYIFKDQSLDQVRSKYVHERQHKLNRQKGNRKDDIAKASTIEGLEEMIQQMSGSINYNGMSLDELADEFICRAMEIAYSIDTDAQLEAELRTLGANEQQIQIIKEINNEQRQDNNLSRARRNSLLNEYREGTRRQDGRDSQQVSNGILEGQGVRPIQGSEQGDSEGTTRGYISGDRSGRPSEVTQATALEESGIQVNDRTGDARFSVNYRLDAKQMDILAEQIAERVGVSKAKAKKWLKAETSLAALCMQEDNVAALYYFADGRYGAIKNNSDYPQGTVDFNNICRKRLDFTNIYLSLQREFPNKVFTAKDLETIRQIMIEDGLEVACGLCYVEDRRQLLGEIANEFRGFLKDRVIPEDLSATKKEVMQKVLDMVGDDTYIPTIAQLLEAGAYELRNSHPSIFEAFVVFNNSRGMQSGRLFEGYAEYKREILDWSDKKVKQVNDAGGLRIFSFSDFEAHHLIDIVQIISDAASKGVMIQGYTKVPEFARAIRNTKVKLNRSLIPLGDTGIQEVDGKKVLAYDTTEGIDVNSENFLDESNNPNVGNVLVGINDDQIRMAMDDANVDYIIPFHTGLKKDILLQKKIGAWVNYKNSQTEKDATTGSSKTADGKKVVGVNIYTDVLQAAEKEGTPIKNRKEFVEYFLKVCKERGLVPRFEQFLARGKNGEYKYTKGYEKLLVDFKMFDKRGNILPQEPVVPIFDDAFNQQIIEDYVKGTKETKEYESTKEKIKENLQLNDYTDDLAESESQVRYSVVTDKKKIEELEASEKVIGYRNVVLNEDGTFGSPMASSLRGEGGKVATTGFELDMWEQAEENPDLADENGKITLVKPDGKEVRKVDYNPYIHNRPNKVNKQFKQAWERPNLVYIETEIAKIDIEGGYHAEKANKSVGIHKWNGGKLILSRYDKPIRIVPWEEVADDWVKEFKKRGVEFDIVPPALLPILHERGVEILPPHKNMGEKCNAAYAQWIAENSKPRFSVTEGTQVVNLGNNTLVGLHNISQSKIRKAIKQGGLANPSAAVIDIAKQNHEGYGEITLVMPSKLVESETGRNAGTYTGDAWSPTYPYVELQLTDKGRDKYYDTLREVFKNENVGIKNRMALVFENMLANQGNPEMLAYWYLLEKGIEPTKVIFNSGISDSVKERFATLREKGSVGNLNAEERGLLIELAAEIEGKTKEDLLQEAQDRIKFLNIAANSNDGFRRRVALATLEDIEEYGVSSRVLSDAFYKIDRAMIEDGKLNVERTVSNAQNYVEEQGMLEDLNSWIENLRDRFIIKEVIFDGYDRNGNRKYVPNTLSNASRLMNRESEQNAYSNTGLSATRAMLIERLETLEDIRNNKHRLVAQSEQEQEEWDQMQDKWFNDVIEPLSKMQKVDSNPFINNDIAAQRLIEAVTKPNPIAYLNREYKYNIPLNGTYAKTLNEMIKQLKEMPTEYFETKFKRPVYLNEFSAAVVPQGLAEDVKTALQGFGMPLFEYDESVEGSRREATLKATEIEGVRFSIIGERGAANLDRAEEATTRLDNLSVAREMESANKDAKTIKMATGWERGADGKWRYEIEDIKLKENPNIQNNGYYNFIDLKDLLDDSALLESYPRGSFAQIDEQTSEPYGMVNMSLGDIRVFFDRFIRNASYEESGKNIWMPDFYRSFIGTNKEELFRVVLSHEIQHAIQDAEGFAVGADVNEDNYERYAGEVEARNVESRLGMSAEERRETLLSETEDVAREDQLFIYDAIENANRDIRFSVSNTNQRIFVSNAERAVESIKQEKATPQQWKAMIEKQGGLKAGEDKWLGLSEWLDSKVAPAQENETMGEVARRVAKNTITKQEILDYIDEHQIQIEEVEYINKDNIEDYNPQDQYTGRTLEELQDEVDANAESGSRYDAEDEDGFDLDEWLMDVMVNEYGEDFSLMYTIEDGYIEYNENFEDINEEYDGKRFINETRLRYVTIGLKNYQEIALTVPTIESWNEGDEVHFGDAGNGRAIAWVRFGETQMETPREVIDHVDELQFAYTNANGQDVYAPQGSKFSKDYAVYGKLANGEMGYVLYVRNNQLSAHPTLEAALEALNAHYEANPRQVTEYSDVLVIDEIQSKRHQEGREKGYATKKDRDIKKKIAKLTDQQDAIFDAMRAREEGRAGITNFTEEETAELKRLGEEIKQLQSELSANNGIIPDAPFDKNWHELAFKRMLRYAAENGFDKVAWTTGAQQAERYDLGKQFDSIEREDNPSINGRRFALNGANYFTFVVNEEGVITESDMSEIQGKPLADVVGKDLAIRMMSLEDGDAIEGADLRIGGEGMKGFYDKILPSFVSKYVKKWGAKVGEVTMPQLQEGYQTMHSVDITPEMKESVMEGQVMFSVTNTAEDLRMSGESSIFAEQYDDVPYISFDEDFDTAEMQASYDERFDDVVADIEMQGAEVDESLLYQKAGVVADYIEDINKEEKYPVVVVPSNKDVYEWMTNKGVSEELARNAQNKLNEKGGDRIRGFHQNGTIFILSQNLDSLSLAKLTYAHEIQHAKNKRNADLIIKVLNAVSRREALDFISKFGNRDVYADLLNKKEAGYYSLADEVVAYAMSEGYKLGINGNLAQYLRDKGITNEELINILNEEYERQKNDVSDSKRFFGQRDIESYRRSVTRRTQQDGGDLQSRPQEMGESTELETLSRGTQGDRGRIARELAEKAKDSLLRIGAKRLARKYELATTPVEHTPMFSVTGAPAPAPDETKREYLKRYMEWRESQIEQAARTKFVQDMKKADKFFEKAAKKIVDRNKPIDDFQKAVVAQGGKLNVGNNAYADTTMAIGRAGYQVRRFADHQLTNMLDAIREMMDSKLLDNIVLTWDNMDSEYTDPKNRINGKRLTVRELIGVYCQAMDVQEAKDKGLPDRGEEGFKKNLRDANGNEVTYEEVIRMVHDAVAGTDLKNQLWDAINDATKFALRYQLAAGMIDQETFDKYDRAYYVPERGWRERDLDGREEKYNESQGMTNGSPYNAALQKAKGRDSLASDPFAYIQSIAETSILSAEKNKVKQKFLQFVFDNEAIGRKTGAWNIRKVWLVEGANGQPEVSFEKPADESKIIKGYATESQIKLASEVRQRTRAERLQHQVIVMRDGVQYIVELESEELANTLNGKYEGMNDLWEGWGNVQRSMVNYMSAINTQYNPVFPVFNFIRDFQLAMISNIGEQDAKFTAKFMKNIGKVQGAIWKYVANEKIMGREAFLATPMGKYLEEYFEQGAQTGFSFLRDIEALNKDIDKALTEGKFKRGAKKTKDVVLGTLSMMTEASELTVRLAQYVTARESGYSAEEAAQMAKEISVNFDRKGTESRALSKLYSFFNASIQGTNKIWRMFKHSKKAKATLLGASALYMALGILNTLLNPDDPEEDVWASDYTRKTNFLFGNVRIPVAHFFRIFYGAGVEIVLAAQGRKTAKQAIFDTANFTADELVPSSLFQIHNLWEYNEMMNEVEFNPAQYVQGAAPSWITPLTDVAMNRNFMGGKINKEPYTIKEEGKYKAGKYAMKNTDKVWIDIADLLSGGDSSAFRDYEEGGGVSGSTLQHIFEGYIGQAGKFVLDAGALPIKAAKGEEITTKDIPYVNRLIIPYKQESAYNQEYWTLKKDLEHYEDSLKDKKKEDREAYWEERGSEQYAAYMRLKRLVNRKPKEGDTHTPEDVRKLMEANKEWRRLK